MSFKEWGYCVFSEFVDINPTVRLDNSKEYSFVEMKDLNENKRTVYPSTKKKVTGGARFQDNDTLFARITPCLENGKICQVNGLENGVGFGSTEFLVFRGKENISDSNFVFYLARNQETRRFAEKHLIGTSGRQRVNKEAFSGLNLLVPEIGTQKRIASILSSLDDKIELNNQTNQTLEAIAQTLFKEMCVPKGDELPEGWKVDIISNLFEVKDGTHNSPKASSEGKYLITSKHLMRDGTIDFGSAYKISLSDFTDINRRSEVHNMDILYSMIGTIGNILLVNEDVIDFSIKNMGLFKTSQKHHLTFFIYLLLKSDFAIRYISERHSGSTQQYITLKTLRGIPIKLPAENTITQFNNQVSPIFNLIKFNSSQIKTLKTIRDTLLPKLMKGEIEVN